jgi:hypothetical protein
VTFGPCWLAPTCDEMNFGENRANTNAFAQIFRTRADPLACSESYLLRWLQITWPAISNAALTFFCDRWDTNGVRSL